MRKFHALVFGICGIALISCGGGTANPPAGGAPPGALRSSSSQFGDVYDFCAPPSCAADPNGPVIFDATGAIYGTTSEGGRSGRSFCGTFGCGAVYKLTPSGSSYVESLAYAFCRKPGCVDGVQPSGPLALDAQGAIYGTAASGGDEDKGIVFTLTPLGSSYKERVLYNFCADATASCMDGEAPSTGVTFGKHGVLYGTASGGSPSCQNSGCGVVFALTPSGKSYTERVVYTFCVQSGCLDGAEPRAGLVIDKKGVLYGTTASGGDHNQGTVFSLTPSAGSYTEHVLYSFCQAAKCRDGASPRSRLIFGQSGTLYGTTIYGGVPDCNFAHIGCGTVFVLTPSGTGYTERVLHAFCHQAYACVDGDIPAGIVFGKNGVLYGAASYGGKYADEGTGCGIIFKLLPAQPHDKYRILYDIGADGRSDTCWPNSTPVFRDGTIYGTSVGLIGIRYGSTGTVWEMHL